MEASEYDKVVVFPAGAGMNRESYLAAEVSDCVPRRRGDEPLNKIDDGS